MPIDPTGTAPGLAGSLEPEPKRLHMKCKNEGCDSIEVIEVQTPPGTGRHVYSCVKCHTTWGVLTGGGIDLG